MQQEYDINLIKSATKKKKKSSSTLINVVRSDTVGNEELCCKTFALPGADRLLLTMVTNYTIIAKYNMIARIHSYNSQQNQPSGRKWKKWLDNINLPTPGGRSNTWRRLQLDKNAVTTISSIKLIVRLFRQQVFITGRLQSSWEQLCRGLLINWIILYELTDTSNLNSFLQYRMLSAYGNIMKENIWSVGGG